MNIEELEKEVDRLTEELSRLRADDPNYRVVSENLERLAKVIGESEKRDLDRNNSNIQNDIREENVRVDMAKVKVDRMREVMGLIKSVIGAGTSVGLAAIAYKGELVNFKLPFRSMWDLAKGLIPKR